MENKTNPSAPLHIVTGTPGGMLFVIDLFDIVQSRFVRDRD